MEITTKTTIEDQRAMEVVFTDTPLTFPWWLRLDPVSGSWDDLSEGVDVVAWDPQFEDDDHTITKRITLQLVQWAFQKAADDRLTHCGGYPLIDVDDADACNADRLLQLAFYGEEAYG